jgi:tripartite-type tricarboxylate transporter receptor subunit TctC
MDFMITTLPSVMGLVDNGTVRPLAVTSVARSKKLPDIPTVAESGWPGYESGAWYGFVVPKGTPTKIVMALRDATLAAINRPTIRERLESEGAEPIGSTPREFAEMMRAESARWKDLVKDAAVPVE